MRVLLYALTLLAGCSCRSSDKPSQTGETDTTAPSDLTDVRVEVSEVIGTVVWVSWTSPEAGVGHVAYGLGETSIQTPVSALGTEHRIAVMGLKADREYTFRAVTALEDGAVLESDDLMATTVGPGLDALPEVVVNDPDRVQSTAGYFAVAVRHEVSSHVLIFDRDGDIVWWVKGPADAAVQTPKLSRDGHGIIWAEWDREKQVDVGAIVRTRLDGDEVVITRAPYVHHQFYEHADGRLGYLSIHKNEPLNQFTDRIYESESGDTEADLPEPIFSFYDNYDPEFWKPCEHTNGGTDQWGFFDADEWTHANSLMYDPADDAYYVQIRFLDALIKIDRASGDVLWQIGGRDSTFRYADGGDVWDDAFGAYNPLLWSHGHMTQIWDGGFMMFDNGTHYTPQKSRITEYAFDAGASTIEEVWTLPLGDFMGFLSDVQKLDNGNLFVLDSPHAEMTEMLRDGTVVWKMTFPPGDYLGRATYLTDNLYTPATALHQ